MNGKKLAQRLRTEDTLLIEKVEKNDYWLSNTYFAVKLNNYDFTDFKDKYNSYKTTESIRKEITEGKTLSYRNGCFNVEDNTPISNVLGEIKELKELTLTNLVIKKEEVLSRIYKVDNEIGYFSLEHNWLLDTVSYENIYSKDTLNPLIFKNANNEINLLIMPMRSEEDIVINEIEKLNINIKSENIETEKNNQNQEIKEEINTGLKRNSEDLKYKKWVKRKNKKVKSKNKDNKNSKKIIYKRKNKYYLYGVELSRTMVKYCKNNDEFKIVSEYDNDKKSSQKTAVCTEDDIPVFGILSENEIKKLKNIDYKKERIDYLKRLYLIRFKNEKDFERAKKLAG